LKFQESSAEPIRPRELPTLLSHCWRSSNPILAGIEGRISRRAARVCALPDTVKAVLDGVNAIRAGNRGVRNFCATRLFAPRQIDSDHPRECRGDLCDRWYGLFLGTAAARPIQGV